MNNLDINIKTITDLDSYLKRFTLHPALIEIGKASIYLFGEHKVFKNFPIKVNNIEQPVTLAQWQLAFLAYRLIMSSNDGRSKTFEYKEILIANSIFAQFGDPLSSEKDPVAFLGRLSQEQFWWQVNQTLSFSRNHILLNEISKEDIFKKRINLGEIFFKEYGISICDYMAIGWAVLSVCLQKPFFNKNNLLNHSVPSYKDILEKNKLDKFLFLASASYPKIRAVSQEINKVVLPGFEKYQFNPLYKYPIIESDPRFMNFYFEAPYLVPNILLLIRKIAVGVYWELREIFKERDSRDFLALFGDIFELYVGKILTNYFAESNVKQIPKDLGEIKIADWLVTTDEVIVIFECKSQLLPYAVRETFNKYMLKEWMDKNIVGGIEQLFSTEEYMRKKGLLGIEINKRKVYKILVTYEEIDLIESNEFKNRIKKYVKDRKLLEKYKHINQEFYIMNIRELELMQNVLKKFRLNDIFHEKEDIDRRNNIAEGNDFISVYRKLCPEINLKNDWLESTYNKYFESLSPKNRRSE